MEFPRQPYCVDAPSDRAKRELDNASEVPPYYHWLALELQDLFDSDLTTSFSLGGMSITVDGKSLDNVLEQFQLFSSMSVSNEYELSSLIARHLDRFLFDNCHVHEGAVLAQFPLQNTTTGDFSIVYFHKWCPKFPVVGTNDTKLDDNKMPVATRESRLYSICSLARCEGFPLIFSIPCTATSIKLEMHQIVNGELQYIKIFDSNFTDTEKLKKFFLLTYGVIRWGYENESERVSSVPVGPTPVKNLELNENFGNHRRVFLKNDIVYKFFDNTLHMRLNEELIKDLKLLESVEVTNLSKRYKMLSYTFIAGSTTPSCLQQFVTLEGILSRIHQKNKVHGDVRVGNIVFGPKQDAHFIDFDHTSECGDFYPYGYNHLAERHGDAMENRPKQFDHDWYSLCYILLAHFTDISSISSTLLIGHLKRHKQNILSKLEHRTICQY